MSVRLDIRNYFKYLVESANPSVYIGVWDGENTIFNTNHTWPCVYISYSGIDFGEQQEFNATTYLRSHFLNVYVGGIGDEIAIDILEKIELSVAGNEISNIGIAELINEELVHAYMGKFLYAQTWKIDAIESH